METEITLVQDREAAKEFSAAYAEATIAAIDLETSPFPWYEQGFKVLTLSVTTEPGHAWVFPVDHAESRGGGLQLFHQAILSAYDAPLWIMQNGAFDHVALLTTHGIPLQPWWDTMVAQYVLDVELPKSLAVMAERYLGIKSWKDLDYKTIDEADLYDVALLNGRDTDVTYQLFQPLLDRLKAKPELFQIYRKLMMPAVYTLCDMEIQGIPVDVGRLGDLLEETDRDLEGLLEDLRLMAQNPQFNPNSYKQMGALLYDKLGLPVPLLTATGNASTNAEALGKIEKLHPIVPKVQEYRGKRKLLTASLIPWDAKLDGDLLHPRYKPAFVKTGRLSSENPNIQQVPRNAQVRGIFGGVEGHQIVEIDYAQMELRIVAWIAGEETMLAAFEAGEDLHQVTADAFGVDRQTAKALNFGLLYGAGPRKLKWIAEEQYGVEISEFKATALRAQWFEKYSAIQDYHKSAVQEARTYGGITTAFGRWRPLPTIHDSDYAKAGMAERQAINTPVQSMASDITLMKLTELANSSELGVTGIRPVATVHDSILFLVPDDVIHMVPIMQHMMEDMGNIEELFGVVIDVPLTTDVKIGSHWNV